VDGLYANPLGYPVIDEIDWIPLCRYAVTKPLDDLPGFVVLFTIEDDETVILREIERAEDY
jgi:hypothetical protein